jgi:hypothetical protein
MEIKDGDDKIVITDDKEAIFHFNESIGDQLEIGRDISTDFGVDILSKLMEFIPQEAEIVGFQGDFKTMSVIIGELVLRYETFKRLRNFKDIQ